MHTAMYADQPDVACVLHTHSPYATAYAVANRPIACWIEALAMFGLASGVPVAAYGPRGSDQAIANIRAAITPGVPAVLLANHGVLVFHRTPDLAIMAGGVSRRRRRRASTPAASADRWRFPKSSAPRRCSARWHSRRGEQRASDPGQRGSKRTRAQAAVRSPSTIQTDSSACDSSTASSRCPLRSTGFRYSRDPPDSRPGQRLGLVCARCDRRLDRGPVHRVVRVAQHVDVGGAQRPRSADRVRRRFWIQIEFRRDRSPERRRGIERVECGR